MDGQLGTDGSVLPALLGSHAIVVDRFRLALRAPSPIDASRSDLVGGQHRRSLFQLSAISAVWLSPGHRFTTSIFLVRLPNAFAQTTPSAKVAPCQLQNTAWGLDCLIRLLTAGVNTRV